MSTSSTTIVCSSCDGKFAVEHWHCKQCHRTFQNYGGYVTHFEHSFCFTTKSEVGKDKANKMFAHTPSAWATSRFLSQRLIMSKNPIQALGEEPQTLAYTETMYRHLMESDKAFMTNVIVLADYAYMESYPENGHDFLKAYDRTLDLCPKSMWAEFCHILISQLAHKDYALATVWPEILLRINPDHVFSFIGQVDVRVSHGQVRVAAFLTEMDCGSDYTRVMGTLRAIRDLVLGSLLITRHKLTEGWIKLYVHKLSKTLP